MASDKRVRQMAGSIKANMRMLLGIMLIIGIVSGLSFWRSEQVDAKNEANARTAFRSVPLIETAPTASLDDSPQAQNVISGNLAPITINDNTTASLYPSVATVSGVNQSITRVRVQLNNFTHTFPDDVDVILEGPQGQKAMVMSDTGGGGDVSGLQLIFDSVAPFSSVLPDEGVTTAGTFRAVNYGNGGGIFTDTFPAPFPAPNTLTDAPADLSVFHQTNPNGQWKLYVVDDAGQDLGSISGGWTLFVTVPAIFTVNSTNDPGNGVCDASECTLREAITTAINAPNNSDQISFDPSFNTPKTIDLLTPLPNITESMAIVGPGANLLTVRRAFTAATDFRIFSISPGITTGVALSGMTISNGRVGDNGGAIESSSYLTLSDLHVTGNAAMGSGGGITLAFADGVFTNCTFSGNTTPGLGGAIYFLSDGGDTLRVASSTISGNFADQGGSILHGNSSSTSSRLEVTNSTIANNSARVNSAGIFNVTVAAGGSATTTLRNTIVALNLNSNFFNQTAPGSTTTFQSLGFNLSDNFGVLTHIATDITSATPRLAPLALYGGQTPTHALLHSSPAIGAGDRSSQTTDQRGQPRPDAGADIGAVEIQTNASLTVINNSNSGAGSLPDAIAFSNANPTLLADILFDNTFFSTQRTITLGGTQLAINGKANIIAPAADLVTVSGGNASRVFSVNSGATATLSGMTITGGNVVGAQDGGGGIRNDGTLTVANCTISGNTASEFGGGIANNSGSTLTVRNSTISGNTANGNGTGGGIDTDGPLNVTNSTISGNSAPNGNNNGGGIWVLDSSTTNITNSTITNNSATGSGSASAIFRQGGTVTLRNSIVAANQNNTTQPDVVANGGTGVTSNGYNLIGVRGALTFGSTGDQSGTGALPLNPLLGPLASNGGPTQTHALLFGSPALDTGNSSGSTSDQRGLTRPIDLAGITNISDATDIGAYEAQTAPVGDTTAPTAVGTVANVTVTGSTNFIATVTYTDNVAINTSTIDVNDIRITGPNGFIGVPTGVFALVPVPYVVNSPGGVWDSADNGTYNIVMQANQVADTSGNFVAAGTIGTFTVNIPPTSVIVTRTDDRNATCVVGDCSLREAIAAVASGGTITFSPLFNSAQTITLGGTELAIQKNLTITGPGANLLTVSGNNQSRAFQVFPTFTATLSGMRITGGNTNGDGGGIYNDGTLTVNSVVVSNNNLSGFSGAGIGNGSGDSLTVNNSTISGNTGVNGGGIFDDGTLTITNSTISGNTSTNSGGGGGGIFKDGGTATVTNSTISGNTASGLGGGIINNGATVTVTNSTIAGNTSNSSSDGGGGYSNSNGTFNLKNTIIANNLAPNSANKDVQGEIASQGYNLIGNSTGATITGTTTGNQLDVNPLLGPLANNGGTTFTHALLAGSPALDKGDNTGSGQTTDQRGAGFARTIDLAGITNTGDGTDIGAFEAQTAPIGDNPPTATATALSVFNGGGSSYPFSVTYSDDIAINVSTLSTGDVTVSGPGGFAATPTFNSVNTNTNGTPRIAFYSFTPPGGTWDATDNGTYNINVAASQVADTGGNFVAAGQVGSFNVTIATPTATPTPASGCTTSYTGPAVVVPDNIPAGVNITLPVSSVGTVSDLNFNFDTGGACDATVGNANAAMDHTFIGDLIFRLTPPDGSPIVTFQAQRGGDRENICLSTLDDEGGFPNISTLTSVTGSPQSGNFSPETTGQLSLLDGENANGNWTLNVSDNANVDTGSMRRFSLVFNTGGSCGGATPTPTNTPTATPTNTPTATPTNTPTATPTATPTVTPTGTPTGTPTATPTPGGGFESDVAPRALNGDGAVTSTDVVQMRRFAATLDVINTATNEFQRADTAPRATAGNGFLDSGDVVQARRYAATLDPLTAGGGPTAPNPEPPPVSMLDEVYAYFFGREIRIGKAVFEGDAISFAVDMTAVGDEAAVGFTLEYDAAAMANPRISLGDGLADDAVLTLNINEAGRIGVLIDSATALGIAKGSTRVITVTFDRIGESSNNKIAFTDVLAVKSIANSNGDLLAVRWIVGD